MARANEKVVVVVAIRSVTVAMIVVQRINNIRLQQYIRSQQLVQVVMQIGSDGVVVCIRCIMDYAVLELPRCGEG
jgi:hypothetical protein